MILWCKLCGHDADYHRFRTPEALCSRCPDRTCAWTDRKDGHCAIGWSHSRKISRITPVNAGSRRTPPKAHNGRSNGVRGHRRSTAVKRSKKVQIFGFVVR